MSGKMFLTPRPFSSLQSPAGGWAVALARRGAPSPPCPVECIVGMRWALTSLFPPPRPQNKQQLLAASPLLAASLSAAPGSRLALPLLGIMVWGVGGPLALPYGACLASQLVCPGVPSSHTLLACWPPAGTVPSCPTVRQVLMVATGSSSDLTSVRLLALPLSG